MSTPKQDATPPSPTGLKALYASDVRELIPSPEYFETEAWFCGFESVSVAKAAEAKANDPWNWRKPE
ncbi:hypothetical protein Mx9_p74 [Myxococcus phage Mx9]|nr:hypothetical protein Mx9_p74 [Myxococcus phage Mx9]